MGKRETDYLNYSRYNAKMQALRERNLPAFEENLLVFDKKVWLALRTELEYNVLN